MQETISLHLGLEPGTKPDFEVTGLAAAAFAEAVREIAFFLDPTMEVRLEFESGTEGSTVLNAILKTSRSKEGLRGVLIGVILGTSAAFVSDTRQWGVQKLLDYYFASDKKSELSTEEITKIANICKDVADGKIAKEPVKKVYKQLERDAVIQSVGTITTPNTTPPSPVLRSSFSERAAIVPEVQTTPRSRTTSTTDVLTLIRPVLLESERPWRFSSAFGEMPYRMDDKVFLQSVIEGHSHISLKAGITITAKVETDEELSGGVWIAKLRKITKVIRVHRKAQTEDLFSQPKKPKARAAKKGAAKKPKRRTPK